MLLWLGLSQLSLSAQNEAVLDSLEIEARNAVSDSEQVLHLCNLAAQYIRYGMPQAEEKLKEGPLITIAENGLEAIEKAAAGSFDLIFMDIKMPRMDGFAATKALRASGLTTPIIALTANATSDEREKCLQSGLDDYLSNPIDVELLRAHIEK